MKRYCHRDVSRPSAKRRCYWTGCHHEFGERAPRNHASAWSTRASPKGLIAPGPRLRKKTIHPTPHARDLARLVAYEPHISGHSVRRLGTRLWPLSRAMYPKQFIRFFDDQDSSFLAATLQRLPRRRLRGADRHLQQRPPVPGQGGGRTRRRDATGHRAGAGGPQHCPAAAVAALLVARDDPGASWC